MADVHKPRHIRDIAHLYISRLEKNEFPGTRSVFVLGATKECFPGYHAANIAGGLVSIDFRVRVIEVSGLWPCSAHFLSLPARIYLKRETQQQRGEEISALDGVAIRFSIPGGDDTQGTWVDVGGRRRSPAGAIDLCHLPPVEDAEALEGTLDRAFAHTGREIPVLLLASNEAEADAAWDETNGLWGNAVRNTLLLNSNDSLQGQRPRGRRGLRHLTDWRRPLADTLPCVLRAPDSYLSRTYISICEVLTSPSRFSKGKHAPRTASRPATAGPAW